MFRRFVPPLFRRSGSKKDVLGVREYLATVMSTAIFNRAAAGKLRARPCERAEFALPGRILGRGYDLP